MASISFKPQLLAACTLLLALLICSLPAARAQNSCAAQLGDLNVCTPFIVPGAPNTEPTPNCCGAIQSVDHDCLCNTIRIAARLPAQCNLPALVCSA